MAKINKETIRVAVVGVGVMSQRVHLPSLATIEGVEIAGLCDINTASLKEVADKYGIKKTYTDYRKMIEETKPDAVYALGQPQFMYDIWIWCLLRGLNLYVEKPLGINLHQAENLAQIAREKECITQVSLQRRNAPLFTQMLAKCLEKGPVVHASCTFNKASEGPVHKSYDIMYDGTIHAVDLLRAICGGEIVKIDSATRCIGISNINVILAMFHFSNGATGMLMSNYASARRSFAFEIHSSGICAVAELEENGSLYVAPKNETGAFLGGVVTPPPPAVPYDAREAAGSKDYAVYGGYRAKHEEFIDSLRTGKQPSSNFSDALKTQKACEVILSQTLFRETSQGI